MSKAADLANLIGNIDLSSSTNSFKTLDNLNNGGGGANRNLIINGAMNVAQRGTSSTSAGFSTVDRFKSGVQTIGITQSQESLSSGEPFEKGFTKFYRQTVTSPSTATNVIMEVKHSVEAQNIANSGWDFKNANRSLSLSFYARSSVSGTYYSYVRNTDASPEQYYRFSFVLSANTWTKVEKTIAGNSNLVFPSDNGEGLAIFWVPAFGTNYSGSSVNLDQWETLTGSDYIPDITHAWGNTNGATFDLTGVQLEVGQNATEFEHEPIERTLAKCQRYFQTVDMVTSGGAHYLGPVMTRAANNNHMLFNCPVTMRSQPTLSVTDSGTLRFTANGSYTDGSSNSITIGGVTLSVHTQTTNHLMSFNFGSVSGVSTSSNYAYGGVMLNDGKFNLDAEL